LAYITSRSIREKPLALDCDEYRVQLPVLRNCYVGPSMMWKVLKDLIGKNITTFSLPVFVNEPITTLMKGAEMMPLINEYMMKACQEEDSLKRMVWMATLNAALNFCNKGRTGKPFNPLLGETYELVTPTYRLFSEAVSHHPPIVSFNC